MDIWSQNSLFLNYVDVALKFENFSEWKKILEKNTDQFEKTDEKLMLLILQTDCHLYLNDGKIGDSLKEIKEINLTPQSEQLQKYILAYQAWFLEGNSQKAYDIFYDLSINYGDLHSVKRGQLIGFLKNSTQQQIDIAKNFKIEKCIFKGKYYYGMLAFAYGEEQQYQKSYECIEKGLSIDQNDPWLHHSKMHNLFFTESNIAKCIETSENFIQYWQNLNAFLKSHNFWHLSLFYLENKEISKVYDIFDKHLWNFSDQLYLENLINGIQLLWKLDISNTITGGQNFDNKRWEIICQQLTEYQYKGAIGYLMYNFLIYKTLLKFNHQQASQYGQNLLQFCQKQNMKCIVIFNFLFEDKYTNLTDLYDAFKDIGQLLGSVEQLLIFQEACCEKLVQISKYQDALTMVDNLLKVRKSPIYEEWKIKIQQLLN